MEEQLGAVITAKPSDDDVLALAQRSSQGDVQAREQLIMSHLYLVDQLVKQNLGRGVDYEDLFQEGCYGLIQAIDRFDCSRGVRLKTYASFWINKHLKQCLREQCQFTPILIYEQTYYKLQQYHYAISHLYETLGRLPSDDEIASYMNISLKKLQQLRQYLFSFVSLDIETKSRSLHGDIPTEHMIPLDKLAPSAEDHIMNKMIDLSAYGVRLTKREEECLCRHLGITPSGVPEPFRVISAATGWSMEVLRRDYLNALKKIIDKHNEKKSM